MSKKVDIDQVENSANAAGIEQPKVKSLVSDLRKAIEEEASLKDRQPRTKKRLIIVANTEGQDEDFISKLVETPMNVVEIPEDGDHTLVVESIGRAGVMFNNESKRGQKSPVKTVFEVLADVNAKFFKSFGITRKSKDMCVVVTTDNTLPNIQVDKEE